MTRIAELQDRLHRLAKRREGEGIYTDAAICEEAAEALSRTGAVKVDRQRLNMEISKWATDSDLHITIGDVEALHEAILSALEPAAPPSDVSTEGQQPVAWPKERVNIPDPHNAGARIVGFRIRQGDEAFGENGLSEPLFWLNRALARPAEQAVTEAMVEAAARLITKWLGYSWDGLHDGRVTDKGFPVFTNGQFGWGFQGRKGDMLDLARNALKAAMEAAG